MTDKLEKPRIHGVYENKFQVRDARYSDLKTVYQMIIELAVDLKADVSEDVELTEKQFVGDFQKGYFHLIVVESKTEHPVEEDVINNSVKQDLGGDELGTESANTSIVGYALYVFGYETWAGRMLKLDDIYIRQKYRKLGIGAYLMSVLADISLQNDCKSFKWNCLDWNTKGLDFYFNKLKAKEEVMEKDGNKYRLVNIEMSVDEMKDLARQIK